MFLVTGSGVGLSWRPAGRVDETCSANKDVDDVVVLQGRNQQEGKEGLAYGPASDADIKENR